MTVYILHFIALLQTFSFRFYANNSLVSVSRIGMIMVKETQPDRMVGREMKQNYSWLEIFCFGCLAITAAKN